MTVIDSIGMHVEGQVNEVELRWLHNMARLMDSVVEIGSWCGRNTYGICSSGCRHVYSIDPFPKEGDVCPGHFLPTENGPIPFRYEGTHPHQYERYVANVGHFTNLTTLIMTSEQAAESPLIPDTFDMVFIDANHNYEFVALDIKLWAPRTKRIVAGHDYHFPGVAQAVKEYLGTNDLSLGPGSIWHVAVD